MPIDKDVVRSTRRSACKHALPDRLTCRPLRHPERHFVPRWFDGDSRSRRKISNICRRRSGRTRSLDVCTTLPPGSISTYVGNMETLKAATVLPSAVSTAMGKSRCCFAACANQFQRNRIVVHADDDKPPVGIQPAGKLDLRKVTVTRAAPRRPEIQQHVLASQIGQSQRRRIDVQPGLAHQLGSRLADQRRDFGGMVRSVVSLVRHRHGVDDRFRR